MRGRAGRPESPKSPTVVVADSFPPGDVRRRLKLDDDLIVAVRDMADGKHDFVFVELV